MVLILYISNIKFKKKILYKLKTLLKLLQYSTYIIWSSIYSKIKIIINKEN